MVQSYVVSHNLCFAGRAELPKQPEHAWVTPNTSCLDACLNIGPGWRTANGGQNFISWEGFCDLAMCAGLLDMPGIGMQWVVGTAYGRLAPTGCDIRCPTSPCWNLPPGATYTYDSVAAGRNVTYTAADGVLKYWDPPFPMKCACVKCDDSDSACQNTLWVDASESSNCPSPSIQPQAGETFPSVVYGGICRNDEEQGTKGATAWLDTQAAICRSMLPYIGPSGVVQGDWKNYSVCTHVVP